MLKARKITDEKTYSKDIDNAIIGLSANSSTKQLFSFKGPSATNPVFTRSTTCWAKNIDTSPQSIWNNNATSTIPFNTGGYGGSGTLISPRHIVYASHFRFFNGTKFVFVDMNNNCYIRTLSNSAQVASLQIGSTDIHIGLLDSDITSVPFAKILDINIATKTNIDLKLPVLFMDQERNALIGEFWLNLETAVCNSPLVTQRANFYELPVGGDSGNPISVIYNNQMLLTFTFFGAQTGPSLSYYINNINSTMLSLGGGYTATTFGADGILNKPFPGRINIKKNNIQNGKIIIS